MSGLELRYFVLKPSAAGLHGKACRAALRKYASMMLETEPELAADLRAWCDAEQEKTLPGPADEL